MNAGRTAGALDLGHRRWIGPVGEAVVAFGCAALIAGLGASIDLDPLVRTAQIGGMAKLQWYYALVALPLIVLLVIAARVRGGEGFDLAKRMACAAIAGLATGMVAGGILLALHGTPWGLNADNGDAGTLIQWTERARQGHRVPAGYPPLPFSVMGWYADLFQLPSKYVMKHMQVIGTAMMGPSVYLSWRLVLKPTSALAVGLVASLPLIDAAPYRPYAALVLLVFVPIAVWFLGELRRADQRSMVSLARRGTAIGAAVGLLGLTYSGWFLWSAPGFLVAMLILFPWRRAPGRGAVLLGFAAATFAAVCGRYVIRMIAHRGIVDKYIYFDVNTEPGYIAMFRGDLPGPVGMWPPLGELGGVGLFTALLVIGLATAIALGRGRTVVITGGALTAGAWLMRFYFAKDLWETQLVQLYPRTTAEILYCLLVLTLYAGHLIIERLQRARDSPLRTPSGAIGAVCGLALLFASSGTLISDHYMPNSSYQPLTPGWLAFQAQRAPR